MGQHIGNWARAKLIPGYDTDSAGLSPLLVTQQSATSGGLWGPMDGAMIDFLGDVAFLFGGWAGSTTNPDWDSGIVTNLVYRSLDFGVTWAKIRDHDLTPDATHFQPCHVSAHCKHSVSGTEYIYLIGGDNNNVHSEVRRTTDGITWTLVAADGVAGWDDLVLGAAGSLNGNLYLAGGHVAPLGTADLEPATVTNEVWRSTDNGATWVSLGNAPWAARSCNDRLVEHNGKLWVIGGGVYSNTVGSRIYYNDVWCYDGTTWTQVLANGLAPWAARFYANVFSHAGWLYISRGSGAGGVNLSDTWRSRDGVTWYEVDLGAGFIASHADGLGVHADGFLWASGNGLFLNPVNTNSPSYFVSSPAAPIAAGVTTLIDQYVSSNLNVYDGVITEGYTEGTNPRTITPGTNDKLMRINMPHRDDTQNPVAIIAGYSYANENVIYIGAGASTAEVSATLIEVRLGTTLTTGGSASKIAAGFSRTEGHLRYEKIVLGCDENSTFGTLTANTAKLASVNCVRYGGSASSDIPMSMIAGYTWDTNESVVMIGGGLNGRYATKSVQLYVAANGTTQIGTLLVNTNVDGLAIGKKLALGQTTVPTVFTIDAIGNYFQLGGDEAAASGHARTDAMAKIAVVTMPSYTGSPMVLIQGYSISGNNYLDWGGGQASYRAATVHRFWATATPTSGYGTEVVRIDVNASATDTGLLLLHDGTMKRVVVGAADSGGTGYRLLRIAN